MDARTVLYEINRALPPKLVGAEVRLRPVIFDLIGRAITPSVLADDEANARAAELALRSARQQCWQRVIEHVSDTSKEPSANEILNLARQTLNAQGLTIAANKLAGRAEKGSYDEGFILGGTSLYQTFKSLDTRPLWRLVAERLKHSKIDVPDDIRYAVVELFQQEGGLRKNPAPSAWQLPPLHHVYHTFRMWPIDLPPLVRTWWDTMEPGRIASVVMGRKFFVDGQLPAPKRGSVYSKPELQTIHEMWSVHPLKLAYIDLMERALKAVPGYTMYDANSEYATRGEWIQGKSNHVDVSGAYANAVADIQERMHLLKSILDNKELFDNRVSVDRKIDILKTMLPVPPGMPAYIVSKLLHWWGVVFRDEKEYTRIAEIISQKVVLHPVKESRERGDAGAEDEPVSESLVKEAAQILPYTEAAIDAGVFTKDALHRAFPSLHPRMKRPPPRFDVTMRNNIGNVGSAIEVGDGRTFRFFTFAFLVEGPDSEQIAILAFLLYLQALAYGHNPSTSRIIAKATRIIRGL
jgi:hypothetical protein